MADLKNIRHIFFDLDDTLWDFRANSGTVLKELFNEWEIGKKTGAGFDEFHDSYHHVNRQMWARYARKEITKAELRGNRFSMVFERFGYKNHEEAEMLTRLYIGKAPHGKIMKEDAKDVLDYLKGKYNLHIITNGFPEIQFTKIDAAGIRGYFSNIIICEEHQAAKPDEKIFRLAEGLAGAGRDECAMVGDSWESDIAGAINAGWKAIYLTDEKNCEGCIAIKGLKELMRLF